MMTPNEFYKKYNGKGTDVDGCHSVQCWDLFARFDLDAGYPVFNCTSSGYVKDIWNNRKKSGILKYFDEVTDPSKMQDGDWAIWGNCDIAPDSHIAMFRKHTSKNRGVFFGQNQGKTRAANEMDLPFTGLLGALRPKCYVKKNACPFTKKGVVKAIVDGIRVRTSPSTKKGDTGLKYNKGGVLYYDSITLKDGWYWAKYKRSNGKTGYCALCDKNGKNKYWKQI